jgi:hypothetical protein
MARITNTELLTKYREKIEQSRRWRTEERYDDLWSRLIDLYRGKHHRTDIKEDQLLVNIAFATINVISPAVSINHPKITVNAKRPEDADKAVVTEAIINYWWQHYGCQAEFRRAVKDFLIVADMDGLRLATVMLKKKKLGTRHQTLIRTTNWLHLGLRLLWSQI